VNSDDRHGAGAGLELSDPPWARGATEADVVAFNRGSGPKPSFAATAVTSPIAELALQLTTVLDDVWHPMGSAIVIQRGLALTAKHVFKACERAYGPFTTTGSEKSGNFVMRAFQFGPGGGAREFTVARVHMSDETDLAVLQLRGHPDWNWERYPAINLAPPELGTRVAAFGYAASVALTPDRAEIDPGPRTAVGQVVEVFPHRRDLALAPFPCFQTNARFDDAMSGGPVFDETGSLCGIICSSLRAETEEEDHASFVSLLWPLAGMEVDAPWSRRPAGSIYPMYDLLSAGGASGLDRVHLEGNGRVAFR
jgi:hypothetical protein